MENYRNLPENAKEEQQQHFNKAQSFLSFSLNDLTYYYYVRPLLYYRTSTCPVSCFVGLLVHDSPKAKQLLLKGLNFSFKGCSFDMPFNFFFFWMGGIETTSVSFLFRRLMIIVEESLEDTSLTAQNENDCDQVLYYNIV